MRLANLVVAAWLVAFAAGCSGPARVTFDHQQCLLDARPATQAEVETEQARIAQRVLERQPLYTVVTIAILLLAGASHIEKIVLLFSARRQEARGLGERLRLALDRYRAHPVRYFGIVTVTLVLLGVAGGLYLYLDADKRASERALGQLQFCALALRSADEQGALDEQRKNLDSIQATAGDIKQLVDSLPPEEQRKAQELLAHMKTALGNQDRLLAREATVALQVQQRSDAIEKGLGALNAGVVGLRALPDQLKELDSLAHKLDGKTDANGKALDEAKRAISEIDCAKAKLPSGKTVGEALVELASRPAPVCKCEFVQPATPAAPTAAIRRTDGGVK